MYLKNTVTYSLSFSQLKKVKKEGQDVGPLTAEEIINYTYHSKEYPSTIVFAIPNAIFDGFDKKEVYEAIVDFKEYDPLIEKERDLATAFLNEIAAMPDGEEKQRQQSEFQLYYGKFDCSFIPKDLIAGILNAQGDFQQCPEWIVLQPNMDKLISIHRKRLISNMDAKARMGVKYYNQIPERNIFNR